LLSFVQSHWLHKTTLSLILQQTSRSYRFYKILRRCNFLMNKIW
jgi:hypothetical protein